MNGERMPIQKQEIPVIDLFAGPGGLSHGFSSFNDPALAFRIALSIEKDNVAHRTLSLRAFLRQFKNPPPEYYQYIRGTRIMREDLEARYPEQWKAAYKEARRWELGVTPFREVSTAIKEAVSGVPYWALLGGPPCQAYSVAGRARMKHSKSFSGDTKHTLYREYLKIVAVHQPAVFVMENVKGILTSVHGSREQDQPIFYQILEDLRNPHAAVVDDKDVEPLLPRTKHRYRIYSFVTKSPAGWGPDFLAPNDFIIQCEDWGVPQMRHRVILFGVRSDIGVEPSILSELFRHETTSIEEVIHGLPRMRSRLSKGDSPKAWLSAIRKIADKAILSEIGNQKVRKKVEKSAAVLRERIATGKPFFLGSYRPRKLIGWLWDDALDGVIQHEARSHMPSDLIRYFFVACAAQKTGVSPKLRDFPLTLLPNHRNVITISSGTGNADKRQLEDFNDRFRVQVKGRPSTTITSHICKDGHYYIHYDYKQCRSLTVREAARLQTFPDNYYFEGNRTQQYHQVGNAVPPLLAFKLARVVANVIQQCANDNRNDFAHDASIESELAVD